MNKEKIGLLSKILPLGSVFIILCSSIKLVLFYIQFNIKITDFLTIGEYATLFVDDLLVYLLIFGYGIIAYESTSKSDQEYDKNLIYVLFKKERIIAIIISLIVIIGLSVSLFLVDSFYVQLVLIRFGIFALGNLLYFYLLHKHTKEKFTYRSLVILAILFWSGMQGLIDAEEIKENRNKFNYNITLNSQTITTNDDLHYLGKSNNFIYLYSLAKKESMILPISRLMKIRIVEKKKNQS